MNVKKFIQNASSWKDFLGTKKRALEEDNK